MKTREKFEAVDDAIGRDVLDGFEQLADGLLASLHGGAEDETRAKHPA